MPPTGSLPWYCDNCGRINEGGQQACTHCGEQYTRREGLYKSGNPLGQHATNRKRVMRPFFWIGLSVSIIVSLSAGSFVFAYLSYTPFHTIHAFPMKNGISSVAWSPDGRVFAAVTFGGNNGSGTAMVSVWRTSDDRQLYTYIYPSAPLFSSHLAWSPDGRSFAIAWDDGNVNIWRTADDASKWQEISSFHLDVTVSANLFLTGLAWSPDGKRLVMSYSDGLLHVWDTVGGHSLPTVQAPRTAPQIRTILALSPDGNQAIVPGQPTGVPDATYAIWEVSTGKVIPLPTQNMVQANMLARFAWSPDGKALAVSNGGDVMIWQWNKQSNSWTFIRAIGVATFGRGVLALAWSSDRQRLATVDSANVVRLWSAPTGDLLGPFRLPLFDHPNSKIEEYTATDQAITGLAWSPDGKYLLSGNSAEQVLLQVVR